jgi:glyoxylase-like metal-dependent hydrolase (beta-lactamase superfamily II)
MELPDWKKTAVEDRDLGHGVHMLESFGGNIGVLAGAEGVLLIDAEWPQLHDKVVAALARISGKPVRYLVDTHWHWDHVGGNGDFARAGAIIFSSAQTRNYITAAQREKAPAGDPYAPDPAAIPAVTIVNRAILHVGGQTVEILHVPPAHTDGDLIVRFVEADVIQTGDTFFHGFYPDIDEPHGGTIDGMIALYDKLYGMCGPNTRIIPGHGPVASREDLREYQAMLRQVRERVARAIADGMTEEQLIASHPLDDLDPKWGGNLVKQPYLLGIVYEDLKEHSRSTPANGAVLRRQAHPEAGSR